MEEPIVNSDKTDSNKKSNGHSEGQINGVSNGYTGDSKHHKSSHKDKKDRDRDHKKDHKSSRDKDKDRDKHSSSKDKDRSKDYKSSSKDKDRDRDRDRDRDKDKDRDKDRDRDRDREKDKDKDRDRDKDKEKDRDKNKEKSDRDRSDRDKDRHKSDKDRHHDDKKSSSSSKDHKSSSHSSSRDKDKEREKDRDKDHKSSSSHDKDKEKDRHKHSSSSSKDKDRDKDRHSSSKDKDKSKSSSSSSKDKDKHHSSSSKDKDKDRDKEKDKDRKDRHDRERDERNEKREKSKSDKSKSDKSSAHENSSSATEKLRAELKEEIKEESLDNTEQEDPLAIKDEANSQDGYENNVNNMSAASSCDYSMSQFKDEPMYTRDTSQMNGDGEYYSDEQEQGSEIKEEDSQSDDDMPLATRTVTPTKRKYEEESDDDDLPLVARKKPKKEKKEKDKKSKKRPVQDYDDDEEEYEEKPKKNKVKKEVKRESGGGGDTGSPKKRKKKEEPEQEVWKWWEEEKKNDGTKWTFLEHKGPVFAPPYEPLPSHVKFYYDGEEMKLSQDAEEVAGFYARMLDHDYTSKDVFNNNFFKDWRKCMTEKEKSKIKDLKKCNFKPMHAYFMEQAERNRNRTKEEKEEIKKKNQELLEEYGFCIIDGHKEKIGNFKIEPPGLFRGRGEHPKMGMLKKRVMPEDVSINCSKDSKIPQPPPGHKWKDVRHDPCVTWLASWTENVQNQVKYVMLNPSSKLKGEKDWQKYETARRLAKSIDKIRQEYREDWKSKEMRTRQRAVALYFIDKLALRAGNEKDEDQADTVGCCSLRVEHIQLHEQKDGKDYVVVFDFLGKDSIRYYNEVPVEKRVFKNLQLFIENKSGSDDLFDRLTTSDLNKHLNELMEGLTAKVFRTYNASWTLQEQLEKLTNPDDSVPEKILSYNRANRAVAILCNHQRSVPKTHQKSMEKLKEKIEQKRDQIQEAERQVKDAKRSAKGGSVKEQMVYDKKKKMLERLREQLKKLEVQETDRDENKTIALGTSKLNYLDPRISVAWCKKFDVPIEKIYNKTQRDKFRWAIDMADADYVF